MSPESELPPQEPDEALSFGNASFHEALQRKAPHGRGRKIVLWVLGITLGLLVLYLPIKMLASALGFKFLERESLGERIIFTTGPGTNRSELYYRSSVTEAEAQRLGQYLVKDGYFGPGGGSVQLRKDGEVYVVACVVKNGVWNDADEVAAFEELRQKMAQQVFPGNPVHVHLCEIYLAASDKWDEPMTLTARRVLK